MANNLGLSYAKPRLSLDDLVCQSGIGLDGLKDKVFKDIFGCPNSYDNILFGWQECSVEINLGQLSHNKVHGLTFGMQVYFTLIKCNIKKKKIPNFGVVINY